MVSAPGKALPLAAGLSGGLPAGTQHDVLLRGTAVRAALAGGRLGRAEPLAITLHDGDAAVARITLEDWSAQAGTTLSPTAGWGAPVNAIEFSRDGDAPGSRAAIYVTLAGTSVGRGWDCVGHAAGTYRNRMRIEDLGGRSSSP